MTNPGVCFPWLTGHDQVVPVADPRTVFRGWPVMAGWPLWLTCCSTFSDPVCVLFLREKVNRWYYDLDPVHGSMFLESVCDPSLILLVWTFNYDKLSDLALTKWINVLGIRRSCVLVELLSDLTLYEVGYHSRNPEVLCARRIIEWPHTVRVHYHSRNPEVLCACRIIEWPHTVRGELSF